MSKPPEDVPQVISIVPVDRNGKVNLKKQVREHLGGADGLRLSVGKEIMLSTRKRGKPAEIKGTRLRLPEPVLGKLGVEAGSLIAFIQRRKAVAIKKFEIVERPAERARIVDYETAFKVERTAETNPMPDELAPELSRCYRKLKLKYSVREFLAGRRTLHAWLARQLLGAAEPEDVACQAELVKERLGVQEDDGSWDHDVVLTARNLRELAQLGLNRRRAAVRKGAEWLLARAQSEANPGMFFLSDRLVAKQAEVLEKRRLIREGEKKGSYGAIRFAERRAPELDLVRAGDDIIHRPCGPRIIWPSALVLEALLMLGYEKHPRVQTALTSLLQGFSYWCECNYQLGAGTWTRGPLPTRDDLEQRERDCINAFRYGGIRQIDSLRDEDLTKSYGGIMMRTGHAIENGLDAYPLRMEGGAGPCAAITTRAMSQVRNARIRRAAEAYLWRFAAAQHAPDGQFEQRDFGHPQAAMLQVFARYEHPASKVAILRSVPWIVENQNSDGSWGNPQKRDANTLAIVEALLRVGDWLPPGMKA